MMVGSRGPMEWSFEGQEHGTHINDHTTIIIEHGMGFSVQIIMKLSSLEGKSLAA